MMPDGEGATVYDFVFNKQTSRWQVGAGGAEGGFKSVSKGALAGWQC